MWMPIQILCSLQITVLVLGSNPCMYIKWRCALFCLDKKMNLFIFINRHWPQTVPYFNMQGYLIFELHTWRFSMSLMKLTVLSIKWTEFPQLNDILRKHGADGEQQLGQAQFAQLLQTVLQDLAEELSQKNAVFIQNIKVINGFKLRQVCFIFICLFCLLILFLYLKLWSIPCYPLLAKLRTDQPSSLKDHHIVKQNIYYANLQVWNRIVKQNIYYAMSPFCIVHCGITSFGQRDSIYEFMVGHLKAENGNIFSFSKYLCDNLHLF